MEKKIREYEKFIEKEVKKGTGKEKLFRLHAEMVKNFQHERLVHLLVMLFFVGITIAFIGITIAVAFLNDTEILLEMFIILGIIDLILAGLSIGYVRHYYFLENHIQGLYKWFKEIE